MLWCLKVKQGLLSDRLLLDPVQFDAAALPIAETERHQVNVLKWLGYQTDME